jgi:hypothetical protein
MEVPTVNLIQTEEITKLDLDHGKKGGKNLLKKPEVGQIAQKDSPTEHIMTLRIAVRTYNV